MSLAQCNWILLQVLNISNATAFLYTLHMCVQCTYINVFYGQDEYVFLLKDQATYMHSIISNV